MDFENKLWEYLETETGKNELVDIMKRQARALDFIERYLSLNLDDFNASSLLRKLREILEGDAKSDR